MGNRRKRSTAVHKRHEEDVEIDAMLPRVPLSVEPVRLQITWTDPPDRQWEDEVESDPVDDVSDGRRELGNAPQSKARQPAMGKGGCARRAFLFVLFLLTLFS